MNRRQFIQEAGKVAAVVALSPLFGELQQADDECTIVVDDNHFLDNSNGTIEIDEELVHLQRWPDGSFRIWRGEA